MNDKDVIEGNLLIAEFMGGKEVDWWAERTVILPHEHQKHLGLPEIMNKGNHTNWGRALLLDVEVKYHSDWNWIMSAYLKAKEEIKSKTIRSRGSSGNIGMNTVHTGRFAVRDAGELILEGKILEAHAKLIEAIKWQIKNKDRK